MAKRNNSPSSSPYSSSGDRRQWQRIFSTVSSMLRSQHSQIQTLADDRKFLESYIHLQHDLLSSTTSLLQSHIEQLKKEEKKGRKVESAKLDLMVGLKQREAFRYKKQLELAETDLEDFRACVEDLGAEISELKEKLNTRESVRAISGDGDSRSVADPIEEEQHRLNLEGEIRKLKASYKKLSSKKEAEISALLAEKDFVWYQLKKMESDYAGIIKSKRIEVEQANEAVAKLQRNLVELQTSVHEKDETIAQLNARVELDRRRHTEEAEAANEKLEQLQLNIEELDSLVREKDGAIVKLRSDLAKFETDMHKPTVGSSRFLKDLSSQLNSRTASVTPTDTHSSKGTRKRSSESAKDDANLKCDGSSRSQVSAPVHGLQRCSSTPRTRSTDSSKEKPVLFHANFK
ncbi:centromere-associated protein E [Iris pallida]|uniref:Centromere-associated protein E n=1 Tax=Iris pallida TaxID=29817 RepID=A0AAX6GMC3_IRIPA|nr:centromere-associated protein E [Iris pallida]